MVSGPRGPLHPPIDSRRRLPGCSSTGGGAVQASRFCLLDRMPHLESRKARTSQSHKNFVADGAATTAPATIEVLSESGPHPELEGFDCDMLTLHGAVEAEALIPSVRSRLVAPGPLGFAIRTRTG